MGHSKSGRVRMKLTSAAVSESLQFINQNGIILHKIKQIDDLTVTFHVKREDMQHINRLAQANGARVELIEKQASIWGLRRLIRRPILLGGILFILLLSLYLPGKVLFIRVEGNSAVPQRYILEQAAECGIGFGTGTRQVRSEKMKNALLQKIPQLQWAGINTYGCVAVISVREKTPAEKKAQDYPISSLVAAVDGYVTDVSVTAGSALCKPGQAVKTGQLLVSAYTDCTLHIQATKAKGEIYADTNREISVLTPSQVYILEKTERTNTKYTLIFGKNQINFSKDSGISGAICDRIKSVYYITLPGGFRLPIALEVTSLVQYETAVATVDKDRAEAVLTETAHDQLLHKTVAGKILDAAEVITKHDDVYLLEGSYYCNEMIAVSRTEEIMTKHE